MSEEYNEALTTLQEATLASVGQTKASQALAENVTNKMAVIDATLEQNTLSVNTALSQLDSRLRGAELFAVSGDQDTIILTTLTGFLAVTELVDNDRIQFIASATNTSSNVSITLDGLSSIKIDNVKQANQLYMGALVTLTYLNGLFYLTQQVNPKTGNATRDIGKLIVDTTNVLEVGEVAFNGEPLNSTEHPIMWAKVQATGNLIDQASKDTDLVTYAGYYGYATETDGSTTFTLPILGGEFIRMFDDGRGVDVGREFGSFQVAETYLDLPIRTLPNGFSSSGSENNYELSLTSTDDFPGGSSLRVDNRLQETRPRNIAYYAKTRV